MWDFVPATICGCKCFHTLIFSALVSSNCSCFCLTWGLPFSLEESCYLKDKRNYWGAVGLRQTWDTLFAHLQNSMSDPTSSFLAVFCSSGGTRPGFRVAVYLDDTPCSKSPILWLPVTWRSSAPFLCVCVYIYKHIYEWNLFLKCSIWLWSTAAGVCPWWRNLCCVYIPIKVIFKFLRQVVIQVLNTRLIPVA